MEKESVPGVQELIECYNIAPVKQEVQITSKLLKGQSILTKKI